MGSKDKKMPAMYAAPERARDPEFLLLMVKEQPTPKDDQ